MPTSPRKLAPKTTAPTTAATASMVPASALRTGTALRPRPASKAIRTPRLPGTEPASPRAADSRESRTGAAGPSSPGAPGGRAAARSAPGISTSSGAPAMITNPAARIGTLTSIPGAGSANRAGPMGISGDAAMAITTAAAAPAVVTTATLARDSTTRPDRLMPRARRIGNSAESRTSWRFSSCPTTASAISPASAAKIARATASGWMARWAAAYSVARWTTWTAPTWYRAARATAWPVNAAAVAPRRSST